MANCAIVVFGEIEDGKGQAFKTALGEGMASQFGQAQFSKKDCVYVKKGSSFMSPMNDWDLVLVWDYEHQSKDQLGEVASNLRPRVLKVLVEQGFVAIIQHSNTGETNLAAQRGAVFKDVSISQRLSIPWHHYSRQDDNPVYKGVAAVLAAARDGNCKEYDEALRCLLALLVPVYDKAIEILSAFLPADLAWQTTNGGDVKKLLPKPEDIRHQFETIKRFTNACLPPASVPQEAINAVAQYLDASSPCSLFTQLPDHPKKFHAHYVALRNRLFEVVEAIERTQGQAA